jgi:hypothetical protein
VNEEAGARELEEAGQGFFCRVCNQLCLTPTSKLHSALPIFRSLQTTATKLMLLCECCGDGDGEPATKFCGDCRRISYFCDDCHAVTHRKGAASHAAISIQEHLAETTAGSVESNSVGHVPKCPKCSKHGKPIEVHCTTCAAAICALCAAFDHDGHGKIMLAEATTTDHREPVFKAIAAAAAVKANAVDANSKCREIHEQVQATAVAAGKTVKGVARVLRQAVTAFENAADAQIAAVVGRKNRAIALHADETSNVAEHATVGIAFAHAVMDVCNPAEQLMFKPLVVEGLTNISKRRVALAPLCAPRVQATETAMLEQAIASIAGAMQLTSGDADASRCAISGNLVMEAGEEMSVCVTAWDFEGNARVTGGDLLEATLMPSGAVAAATACAKSGPIACTVVDNRNGTYTCTCIPSVAEWGERELHVKVNLEHIAGSPFAVKSHASPLTAGAVTVSQPHSPSAAVSHHLSCGCQLV